MEILVEEKWLSPHTYIWKKKETGYKGLVCAFILDMEAKGYFKEDIIMNYELCKTVALNTFHVDIKSNKTYYTCALAKDKDKKTIPIASTID